jgi:hypothetical protein
MSYERAILIFNEKPDGAHQLGAALQLCGHARDNFDDAEVFKLGGVFVFDLSEQTLTPVDNNSEDYSTFDRASGDRYTSSLICLPRRGETQPTFSCLAPKASGPQVGPPRALLRAAAQDQAHEGRRALICFCLGSIAANAQGLLFADDPLDNVV